jgi:uncharacterized metal-binding protein
MKSQISLAVPGACLSALVAVAAFNSWISRINQFFFFSRSASNEFASTSPAQLIIKRYLNGVWLGLASSIVVFAGVMLWTRLSVLLCLGAALTIESFCCCLAFAKAHREAGHAIAKSVASDEFTGQVATVDRGLVSVSLLGPGTFTRSMLVTLVVAPLFAAVTWLVPMAVTHMNFGQFADSIAANKADFLSGLGAGLIVASLLLYAQLRYFSRNHTSMARFTARGCVVLAWLGAASIAVSTLSVPFHFVITREIRGLLLGVILAVAILRLLYGWTCAKLFSPPDIERNGDQFWRWGLFYYNPSDPTLFIQHRAGPGYTVNFANFMSWPLTIAILADCVYLFSIHLHR